VIRLCPHGHLTGYRTCPHCGKTSTPMLAIGLGRVLFSKYQLKLARRQVSKSREPQRPPSRRKRIRYRHKARLLEREFDG